MGYWFNVPDSGTGVYVLWDEEGKPLYIGATAWSPYQRVLTKYRELRRKEEVKEATFYPTSNQEEAFKAELILIKELHPKYNRHYYIAGRRKCEASRQTS